MIQIEWIFLAYHILMCENIEKSKESNITQITYKNTIEVEKAVNSTISHFKCHCHFTFCHAHPLIQIKIATKSKRKNSK